MQGSDEGREPVKMKYIIASDLHAPKCDKPLMDEVFAELTAGPAPGTLILAGDYTCKAKEEQYEEIAEWICLLRDKGVNIVMAPGNHDTSKNVPLVLTLSSSGGKKRYGSLADLIADQPIVEARMNAFDFIFRVDRDVFYATRTTHSGKFPILKPKRIKVRRKQLEWARDQLLSRGFTAGNGYRLHMVCHHSMWSLKRDVHGHMDKRKRLVKELLEPLGFVTFINGHNHSFARGRRQVKKTGFYIDHIQAPTLSSKTKCGIGESGYVRWDPEVSGSAKLVSRRTGLEGSGLLEEAVSPSSAGSLDVPGGG